MSSEKLTELEAEVKKWFPRFFRSKYRNNYDETVARFLISLTQLIEKYHYSDDRWNVTEGVCFMYKLPKRGILIDYHYNGDYRNDFINFRIYIDGLMYFYCEHAKVFIRFKNIPKLKRKDYMTQMSLYGVPNRQENIIREVMPEKRCDNPECDGNHSHRGTSLYLCNKAVDIYKQYEKNAEFVTWEQMLALLYLQSAHHSTFP